MNLIGALLPFIGLTGAVLVVAAIIKSFGSNKSKTKSGSATTDLSSVENAINNVNSRIDNIVNEIQTNRTQIQNNNNEIINSTNAVVQEVTNLTTTMNQRFTQVDTAINDLRTEITSRFDNIDNNIATLSTSINEVNTRSRAMNQVIRTLPRRFHEVHRHMQSNLRNLRQHITQTSLITDDLITQLITDLYNSIMNDVYNPLNNQINDFRNGVVDFLGHNIIPAITLFSQSLRRIQSDLTNFSNRFNTFTTNDFQTLVSTVNNLDAFVTSDLSQAVERNGNMIIDVYNELINVQTNLSENINDALKSVQSELNELKNNAGEAKTRFDNIDKTLKNLDNTIKNASKKLQPFINNVSKNFDAVKKSLDELKKEQGKAKEEFEKLNNSFEDFKTSGFPEAIKGLKDNITQLSTKIEEALKNHDEKVINELKKEISDAETKLTTLIKNLPNEVKESFNDEFEKIGADLKDLKKGVEENKELIKKHDESIKKVLKDIDSSIKEDLKTTNTLLEDYKKLVEDYHNAVEKQDQLGEDILKSLKEIDGNKLEENSKKLEELINQLKSLKEQAKSVKKSESTAEAGDVINNYIDNSTKIINNINNQIIVITEFYSNARKKIPREITSKETRKKPLTPEEENLVKEFLFEVITLTRVVSSINDVKNENINLTKDLKKLLNDEYPNAIKTIIEELIDSRNKYEKELKKLKEKGEDTSKIDFAYPSNLFNKPFKILKGVKDKLERLKGIQIEVGTKTQVRRQQEKLERGRVKASVDEVQAIEAEKLMQKISVEFDSAIAQHFRNTYNIIKDDIENLKDWFFIITRATHNFKRMCVRGKGVVIILSEKQINKLIELISNEETRLNKAREEAEKLLKRGITEEEVNGILNKLEESLGKKVKDKAVLNFAAQAGINFEDELKHYEEYNKFLKNYEKLMIALMNSLVEILNKRGREDYSKYLIKLRRKGVIEGREKRLHLNMPYRMTVSKTWKQLRAIIRE